MQQVDCGKGYFALVDNEDYDLVMQFQWNTMVGGKRSKTRYARCDHYHGIAILMHRLVMNAGEDELVDHKNGNGLDNRKENLQLVDYTTNNLNARKRVDRPFTYKGVRKVGGRFRAYCTINKHQYHLGYFDTEEEAGNEVLRFMKENNR